MTAAARDVGVGIISFRVYLEDDAWAFSPLSLPIENNSNNDDDRAGGKDGGGSKNEMFTAYATNTPMQFRHRSFPFLSLHFASFSD